MPLQIMIDLDDTDLQFFIEASKRAQQKSAHLTPQQITEAASKLLTSSSALKKTPDFIATRLSKLDSMINMVNDTGWALSDDDRKRVLSALIYFAEPDDVIPDDVPVLGYLDDAIMIELCQRELQHDIEAYEEFVSYRAAEAAHRGVDINSVKMQRVDWLEARRRELQQRMWDRRNQSYVGGSGSSFTQQLFRVG